MHGVLINLKGKLHAPPVLLYLLIMYPNVPTPASADEVTTKLPFPGTIFNTDTAFVCVFQFPITVLAAVQKASVNDCAAAPPAAAAAATCFTRNAVVDTMIPPVAANMSGIE